MQILKKILLNYFKENFTQFLREFHSIKKNISRNFQEFHTTNFKT